MALSQLEYLSVVQLLVDDAGDIIITGQNILNEYTFYHRMLSSIGKQAALQQPGHSFALAAEAGMDPAGNLAVVLSTQAVSKAAEGTLAVWDRTVAGRVGTVVAGPFRTRFESLDSGLAHEKASSHHPFASLRTTQRPWL